MASRKSPAQKREDVISMEDYATRHQPSANNCLNSANLPLLLEAITILFSVMLLSLGQWFFGFGEESCRHGIHLLLQF